MVNTIKFSQFAEANLNDSTNTTVGTGSGINVQTPITNRWTTAQRPATPYDGLSGYNTDLGQWEFWNVTAGSWIQFSTGGSGVTLINTGTGLTGGPITSSGTISLAPIADKNLLGNNSGITGEPDAVPFSLFLEATNNLSDVSSASAARTNLGLAIGTNVEAWSHTLDLIAAGTWPGSTSLTTLGTITTGVWHGSPVTVPFGGTGDTSFTPYSVICGGTSNTAPLQNVATVGLAGQVLTSQGAGQLPIWSNTSGSGTVNSGTINQLAWYAATGSTVSGLSTANNGVLITSSGGVPSIGSTLPVAVQGNITTVGIVTSGTWEASILGMIFGGTGANLTPTANNLVVSGASALGLLATGNNGVLVTDGGGVPSISSTLPIAVQSNITGVGTVTSGQWNSVAIAVPFGGTALTSTTPYAVICGGTTSTDALQQVSGLGTLGQVLTSQGAGTLPIWSSPTGTGTVTAGLINQLTWYAASGATVSGLPTSANGVLITSSGSVPSISSTLPAAVQGNITGVGTLTQGIWNGSTIEVSFGGTGNTTFTAYSVICAGTTATGAFQNVAGLGTSGQVLTSNGAGSLPTWQTSTSSGTVNTGTINDLAYYASSGTAVSPLTTGNNAVLVTSGSGVPSWNTALGQGLVVASSVLTVGGANNIPFNTAQGIQDNNGNALLLFTVTGSSVNSINITNAATGTAPILGVQGSNASINLEIESKSGTVSIIDTAHQGILAIYNTAQTFNTSLTVNATQAANYAITLPGADGSNGSILQTNGSGAWTFSTATYPTTTTINQLLYSSASNTVGGITAVNNGVLISSATGVPSWLANSATAGFVLTANSGAPPSWQASASGMTQNVAYTNNLYPLPILHPIVNATALSETFTPTSGTAYCIYVGTASQNFTLKNIQSVTLNSGSGTQTSEVGIFSSPSPPSFGTGQTLTKIFAVSSLGDYGIQTKNSVVCNQAITSGTNVWLVMRTAFSSAQPGFSAVVFDQFASGALLTQVSTSALTGITTITGVVPTFSFQGSVAPLLMATT